MFRVKESTQIATMLRLSIIYLYMCVLMDHLNGNVGQYAVNGIDVNQLNEINKKQLTYI